MMIMTMMTSIMTTAEIWQNDTDKSNNDSANSDKDWNNNDNNVDNDDNNTACNIW